MAYIDQKGLKRSLPPFVAARCQRAQRVAVIALAPGDDLAALGLARSRKYCRASFSAASMASDPPETK